jgi:hypothetical protein
MGFFKLWIIISKNFLI